MRYIQDMYDMVFEGLSLDVKMQKASTDSIISEEQLLVIKSLEVLPGKQRPDFHVNQCEPTDQELHMRLLDLMYFR